MVDLLQLRRRLKRADHLWRTHFPTNGKNVRNRGNRRQIHQGEHSRVLRNQTFAQAGSVTAFKHSVAVTEPTWFLGVRRSAPCSMWPPAYTTKVLRHARPAMRHAAKEPKCEICKNCDNRKRIQTMCFVVKVLDLPTAQSKCVECRRPPILSPVSLRVRMRWSCYDALSKTGIVDREVAWFFLRNNSYATYARRLQVF